MSTATATIRSGLTTCIHCGTAFTPPGSSPTSVAAAASSSTPSSPKTDSGNSTTSRKAAAPVKSLVFQKRDLPWLDELAAPPRPHRSRAHARSPGRLLHRLRLAHRETLTRRPGALASRSIPPSATSNCAGGARIRRRRVRPRTPIIRLPLGPPGARRAPPAAALISASASAPRSRSTRCFSRCRATSAWSGRSSSRSCSKATTNIYENEGDRYNLYSLAHDNPAAMLLGRLPYYFRALSDAKIPLALGPSTTTVLPMRDARIDQHDKWVYPPRWLVQHQRYQVLGLLARAGATGGFD